MKDLKEKNDFKVAPSSLPLLKGDLRGMFSANIYRRGGVCPPENIAQLYAFGMYAFGRANPAPTVDESVKTLV
jgi:hypothetical protein